MSYGRYIQEYRKNAVVSASPLRLIIMLYDAALRFIQAGKEAMLIKNPFEQNQNLVKAQSILIELTSALDFEKGGEIAINLNRLYYYIYDQLVQANVNDQPETLDHCSQMLRELRESWMEIEASQKRDDSQRGLEERLDVEFI